MIRLLTTLAISFFIQTSALGQNYWFGFLTSNGDTLNKKDSLGYWQGLHVRMYPWECNKLHDTCEYVIGVYEHGQPIGNWTDYKKDGTFSIGHYNSGVEVTYDKKGGWTEKHQGIYAKIGIWQFFDKDSNLLKTERYDRSSTHKGWTTKTFIKDSSGNFVLREYEFMNQKNLNSPFKTIIHNYYFDNGKPDSFNKMNFWKDSYTTFYPTGKINHKFKCIKIFGVKTNHSITKIYDSNGELTKKVSGKCVTKITDPSW